MTDMQWLFEAAAAQFRDVVASLRHEDWSRPTNCEVSVAELVEQVVNCNAFVSRPGTGVRPIGASPDLDPGTDPQTRLLDAFGRR